MRTKHHPEARKWITSVLAGQAELTLPATMAWQAVLQQSEEEGVTPLLHHHLQRTGQLELLPPAVQASLQKIDLKHVAADIATKAELHNLVQILHSHKLDFIILKGEALSHSIYTLPHLRTKTDIDLLFSSKDESERAAAILQKEGFERMLSQQGTFVGYQFVCQKQYSISFQMVFDVHNEITNHLWFNRRLTYAHLAKNSQFIEIENSKVRILNTVHALIHACVHRITNKSKQTADRLIWLYDIHLLSQRLSDTQWQRLIQVCADKNLSGIILQGLEQSQAQLASNLPPEYLAQLSADAATGSDPFTQNNRRIQMYWEDFILNPGFGNKLTQIRERVFPPADYMLKRYDLNNKRWLAFYYLKRIINVIINR